MAVIDAAKKAFVLGWGAAALLATGGPAQAQAQMPLFKKRWSVDYGLYSPGVLRVQRGVGSTWNRIGVAYQVTDPRRVRDDRMATLVYLDASSQGDDVRLNTPPIDGLERVWSYVQVGVGAKLRISSRFRRQPVYLLAGLAVSSSRSSLQATRGGVPRNLETSHQSTRLGGKFGVGTDFGRSYYGEIMIYENGKTKPPLALVKLFKLLDRHPDLLDELRAS